MGKKDNLFAGILSFLIIIIILTTTYFCLDIFGIIKVPDKLSLVKLLIEKTDKSIEVKPVEELIITEENIDDWINKYTDENTKKQNNEASKEFIFSENTLERPELPTTQNEIVSEKTEKVINKMYYYQLDMYGKMIYDRMYDSLDNLKTGIYTVEFDTLFNDLLHEENGEAILENAFQFGINALLFDHPEIFYLDITKMYMSTEITSFGPIKIYRVSIGGLEGESYLSTSFNGKQSVDVVCEMIDMIKANIEREITNATPYNKIKYVHDYLIKTVEYDQTISADNIYNIFGALMNKKSVCEGYAKAFKFLMDEFNIPSVIVCGIGQNSNGKTESHAWNYVKLDNKWYAIDCTWDDPIILGTGYVSDEVYYKYFLKGSNDFFNDHIEDGKIVDNSRFIYPTLSEENY